MSTNLPTVDPECGGTAPAAQAFHAVTEWCVPTSLRGFTVALAAGSGPGVVRAVDASGDGGAWTPWSETAAGEAKEWRIFEVRVAGSPALESARILGEIVVRNPMPMEGEGSLAEHPDSGALETSAFTSIRLEQGEFRIQMMPVAFTRVRPGETLLEHVA